MEKHEDDAPKSLPERIIEARLRAEEARVRKLREEAAEAVTEARSQAEQRQAEDFAGKTKAPKSLSERLNKAKVRAEQARTRMLRLEQKMKNEQRRDRTRRLICLGAFIESNFDEDIAQWFMQRLRKAERTTADEKMITILEKRVQELLLTVSQERAP